MSYFGEHKGKQQRQIKKWCGFTGIVYNTQLAVRILNVPFFAIVRLSVYTSYANLRRELSFRTAMQ